MTGLIGRTLAGVSAAAMALVGAASATAQGSGLSNAYLNGVWKEDKACRSSEFFQFDAFSGQMQMPGQGPFNYNVTAPNQITISGSTGSLIMNAQYVDNDTILATYAGATGPLYRCSGGAPVARAAPARPAAPPSSTQSVFGGPSPFATTPPPVSVALLTGKWEDNLLCIGKTDAEFTAGSQVSFKRSAFANYSLSGQWMTIAGNAGPINLLVQVVDKDHIFIGDGAGSQDELFRC